MNKYVNLLFDGPPGSEAGRFIEAEDEDGISLSVGQWIEPSDDAYWRLRITAQPTLNNLSEEIHDNAAAHGFWPDERLNAALDFLRNRAMGPDTPAPDTQARIDAAVNMLRPRCERNFAEMLMLIVSELAESMESHREGEPAVWLRHQDGCPMAPPTNQDHGCGCDPKPEGAAVELGDALIRILDTMNHPVAGAGSVDIDGMLLDKMQHNSRRPPMHGKSY